MLNLATKLLPRMAVVDAARKYLGRPWEFGGRHREGGIDCGGLMILVVEDLGLQDLMPNYNPPTTKTMLSTPHVHPESMYACVARAWIEIPIEDAGIGDCELYFIRDRNISCHCVILTDKGFIHTHQGVGKVVETSRCKFWDRRRTSAFRFAGIEE